MYFIFTENLRAMPTREELEREYLESYNSKGWIWVVLTLGAGAVMVGLSFFVIVKFVVKLLT
jgi:hypothetical protein